MHRVLSCHRILLLSVVIGLVVFAFVAPCVSQKTTTPPKTARAQPNQISGDPLEPAVSSSNEQTSLEQKNQSTPQQRGPTAAMKPSPEQTDGDLPRYSTGALVAVMVVFALLALLFVAQMIWSHRLDQTSYLSKLYVSTLKENEYNRLTSRLVKRHAEREYHRDVEDDPGWVRENPRPERVWRYGENRFPAGTQNPYGTPMPGLPMSSQTGNLGTSADLLNPDKMPKDPEGMKEAIRLAFEERRKAQEEECKADKAAREWYEKVGIKAEENYRRDLAEARQQADEMADLAGNVDLGTLHGRGPEFVLGFTTIVAIVFAAVALGILDILDSQQIGTLFAAIAGYVLGRATAQAGAEKPRRTPSETETPPSTPKEKAKAAEQS